MRVQGGVLRRFASTGSVAARRLADDFDALGARLRRDASLGWVRMASVVVDLTAARGGTHAQRRSPCRRRVSSQRERSGAGFPCIRSHSTSGTTGVRPTRAARTNKLPTAVSSSAALAARPL